VKKFFGDASENKTYNGHYTQTKPNCYNAERNLRVIMEESDTIKDPIGDPCTLNVGWYNWVLTVDYEFTFGRVFNKLEWGVKHKLVASNRAVWAAGEFNVFPNETTIWNTDSGSYIYTDMSLLKTKMKNVFKDLKCESTFISQSRAFKKEVPTYQYMTELCSSKSIKKNSNKIDVG